MTKDFTPISMIYDLPIVMVVNPSKLPGVDTLPKLIETARAQKDPLNYTTSGAGSFGHMSMELLKDLGKFNMQHVAYKGGVPAITDTIGGQVPIMYADLVAALPTSSPASWWPWPWVRPSVSRSSLKSRPLPSRGLMASLPYRWAHCWAPRAWILQWSSA